MPCSDCIEAWTEWALGTVEEGGEEMEEGKDGGREYRGGKGRKKEKPKMTTGGRGDEKIMGGARMDGVNEGGG